LRLCLASIEDQSCPTSKNLFGVNCDIYVRFCFYFIFIPFLLFLLSFSQSSTLVLVFKRTFNTYWQDAVDALQEQITFEDPSLGEDPDKPSGGPASVL
jgi:hypothetical protein